MVLLPDGSRISNRHCGLDDHDCARIRLHDQLDHIFHSRRIEVLGNGIVICRSHNNNKVRIVIGALGIQRCGQVQFLLSKVFLDILILYRGLSIIDKLHFFRDDVHGIDLIVLCQQYREG